MKKYIIKYGVIGGIVSSILGTLNWLLFAKSIGVSGSQAMGYTSIVLSLLCIPLGIHYFKHKLNNGFVSFGQAVNIGFGITFIAGCIMAIHSILFFALQKDEFLAWQRNELNEAELLLFNEQLAQMPEYAYAPWFQGIIMFLMVLFIGAVVNFISALVLKRSSTP